jgi:hypothetical protein
MKSTDDLGTDYEQYLAEKLTAEGKAVERHKSKDAQLAHGDLRVDGSDVEVKLDQQFHVHGNLFVEVEERRRREGRWTPSGIFAASSATWYWIGDYCHGWLFLRRRLRDVENQRIIEIKKQTSRGWLMRASLRERPVYLGDSTTERSEFIDAGHVAWLAQGLYRIRRESMNDEELLKALFGDDYSDEAPGLLRRAQVAAEKDAELRGNQ